MAKKQQNKPAPVQKTVDEEVDEALSSLKLGDLVLLAEELPGLEVASVSTGFPQLDYMINPSNPGLPRGRHIEIYSKDPSAGKTTLALQMAASWQRQGYKTFGADVERTWTNAWLEQQGLILRKGQVSGIPAFRLIRAEDEAIPAETILDAASALADIMDLGVIDSIAALEEKAELEKQASENDKVGGISKKLSSFFRKNLCKKASLIWINQMREAIGVYSPAGPVNKTTGGKAVPFYASVRLELSRVETIKPGDDAIGMRIQVLGRKNKMGPPDQKTRLTFLYGIGFSSEYDYFELAVKNKAVTKSGGWYAFEEVKVQGDLNFIKKMMEDPKFKARIVQAVDGEDVIDIEEIEPESEEKEAA